MSSRLIIDGNAVYEIDEECLNRDALKRESKDFSETKPKTAFPNGMKSSK